jgi:hypothetical protein
MEPLTVRAAARAERSFPAIWTESRRADPCAGRMRRIDPPSARRALAPTASSPSEKQVAAFTSRALALQVRTRLPWLISPWRAGVPTRLGIPWTVLGTNRCHQAVRWQFFASHWCGVARLLLCAACSRPHYAGAGRCCTGLASQPRVDWLPSMPNQDCPNLPLSFFSVRRDKAAAPCAIRSCLRRISPALIRETKGIALRRADSTPA